jgi:DNA-binding response OmpR family regulator
MNEERRPEILWVDDEIDLLKSQLQFLENRGYKVTTVTNGPDAVALVRERPFDAVLLDEIMVGMDGIETLRELKAVDASLPVIMVTKSTEETLMDDAYFGEIDDFLVKPVNPHQILSSLKKILDLDRLRRDRFVDSWGEYYHRAQGVLHEPAATFAHWAEFYLEMCRARREIDELNLTALDALQSEMFAEADANFAAFACDNYPSWVAGAAAAPPLSWQILDRFVFPHVEGGRRVYFVVVDCLRLDQWLLLEERLAQLYRLERTLYCGALPSSTLYARNALFAGKPPLEIARRYKDGFREESGLGESLNRYEEQFLADHAARHAPRARKIKYYKFANREQERKARKIVDTLSPRPLTAFVFNFIDTVTHESGRGGALDALAPTVDALPRLALTWYLGSPLEYLLRKIAEDKEALVVLTSDHGSTFTDAAAVVYADKEATKTPRYWVGRDLRPESPGAFLVRHPEEFGLPVDYLAKTYVLAQGSKHLVFSHHLREYHRRFEGGFYHGGVSLPELVLPLVTMTPK